MSKRVRTPYVAQTLADEILSKSRVAWECSPKWEVNSF
jgi:hypothetical protein